MSEGFDERTFPRGRVLVVDDDTEVRGVLSRILEKGHYDVESAGNVGDGLAVLGTRRFDILVVDMGMHGPDGLDLVRKARCLYPTLRIIAITAMGGLESSLDAIEAGASDCLGSPARKDQLLRLVAQAFVRNRPGRFTNERGR